MILEKLFLDVVDPFLVPEVAVFEAVVLAIETVVIYFLLERAMKKAFVASFTANLVTGILSVFYLLFSWEVVATLERFAFMLVVGLLVNIFVEAGVLRLFYKTTNVIKLLLVSTVMNSASYAPLIFWFLDMFASQLTSG